ncbi:hypothetical protein RvY_18782 [Ramazzottius varieornatus]|uniref:Uncharacterized protein n=1 Tax=Ramazzottius varieornatus TaxID=947166 RepID=A0A1D1W7B0_RAMVA|nr:hypothetical protein RvY_18782 [Ramazzottius varieornatus]
MSRLAISRAAQVSQPLAPAIKGRHILDLSASSTVMDYYLASKGNDKTKFHGNNFARGLHFSELQLVHDE